MIDSKMASRGLLNFDGGCGNTGCGADRNRCAVIRTTLRTSLIYGADTSVNVMIFKLLDLQVER